MPILVINEVLYKKLTFHVHRPIGDTMRTGWQAEEETISNIRHPLREDTSSSALHWHCAGDTVDVTLSCVCGW